MNCPSHVSFLDGEYSIVHIPLHLYAVFLQPILRILLPYGSSDSLEKEFEGLNFGRSKHGFLNISVTPIECSVVCDEDWIGDVFTPLLDSLPPEVSRSVVVSTGSYLILSVISAGVNAGSRVVGLTSPLALAGIPIFFITTYWSDFILVQSKDRQTVVEALLARDFKFSAEQSAFVPAHPIPASPYSALPNSQGSSRVEPPPTPPPNSDTELQTRTFTQLRTRNVVPFIEPGLTLVMCSGQDFASKRVTDYSRRGSHGDAPPRARTWLDDADTRLYLALVTILTARPRFLSFTVTEEEKPSLLLDKIHIPIFDDSLIGDTGRSGRLTPIFLDLDNFPLEATGIVSGVAGKLLRDIPDVDAEPGSELSYLSTARAGAVILPEAQAEEALQLLLPLCAEER